MNLKYAALGLIAGYLGAYILEYLQNQNTANAPTYTNDGETTFKNETN
jgi:hypothetical protein